MDVRELAIDYSGIHGSFSYRDRSKERERILVFMDSIVYHIMNTYFRKDVKKLVTYESKENRTVTNYDDVVFMSHIPCFHEARTVPNC